MKETFERESVYRRMAAAQRYGFEEGLRQASFLIAEQLRTHGRHEPPATPDEVVKALREFRAGVERAGHEIGQWEGWLRVCDALDALDGLFGEE